MTATPLLSLDSLTLSDTLPADAIRAAAAAGFAFVSLWTLAPAIYPRQLLTSAMEHECARLLSDLGIQVHNIEAFDLIGIAEAKAVRPALELGARLGAKAVVALHHANPDRAQAVEALAALNEEASQVGLSVNLEPVAMGVTRTLNQAEALIRDAGIDAGILFDTYHFVRAGSSIEDLQALPPGRIRYVQVCDGMARMPQARWIAESLQERLYPGSGEFSLTEIVRCLPADVTWGVETPSRRRASAGLSPLAQACEVHSAMTRLCADALVGPLR